MTYTLEQIAEYLKASLVLKAPVEASTKIFGLGTLEHAKAGQVSFLSNPKYIAQLASTEASAVMVTEEALPSCPVSALILKNPYLGFAKLAALFQKKVSDVVGIHPSATIDPSAEIDPSASIGAGVVIGPRVKIASKVVVRALCVLMDDVCVGEGTIFYPRVTVYPDVRIGARCMIHSGAIIGSDGFGLANDRGQWVKIAQLGTVVIQDDVEIGANTTIDRGALEDTRIGRGVKLDNQIQIAHNVVIGDHTAIAAQAGIAGSTKIGRYCLIGGGSTINGHIKIGDQVHLGGHSTVIRSIEKPGIYVSVLPVCEQKAWHKSVARFYQLDQIARRLKQCEKSLGIKSKKMSESDSTET